MVTGGAAGASVGTWTVLFTDQVGSTAMRVRVGEAAFDEVRADLDARLGAALDAHGAGLTKSIGDGIMGGFTSTAAALRCAVAIQQAVAQRNRSGGLPGTEAVALRVGISVGDAVVEDGDLQGTAVVEAARLCAAATGGSILCSESVRTVSANRSGCTFGPARTVVLKGLRDPVVTHEVLWVPLPYQSGADRTAFRVLGPLEVLVDGRPAAVGGPKERVVLAVLLARANSHVSMDALVDAVWDDRPPRTAERTVHAYVARLRRALEPGRPHGQPSTMLVTVDRGYELRVAGAQLDALRFVELASRGRRQLARRDDAAPATLHEALGLWRGRAFGEFGEVEACRAESRRLEELRLALVEDRVEADIAAGRSSELIGEIEALVRDEPFRERLWAQLIVALYRCGRQRDALDTYQRARRLLVDELGIEPGPELRRLEAAVLAQDPSLDVLRPTPTAAPGDLPAALAAVGPAFLGRESELAGLREAWADASEGRGGLVSVLGPEGIGKSRLVAELARQVHDEGATVLYGRCDHARPGARALFGQALQSAGSSLAYLDGAAGEAGDIAEAVARYLPSWSEGRPVLIVLDDLHLANSDTLEVVADLAGWCRAAPMLVVGAFRSDVAQTAGPGEAPGGTGSQLALAPLGKDDVGRICELYATDAWSAQDVDRLFELTGGVPLSVHEQASEWARERASRRVADAGDRSAASRRRLIASRGEIADGVEGIQQLLEQRRVQLAGREAQLRADAVAALSACPYKGLARFEQADAPNFFGRERLVAELIARLAETPLLAVVGPSGSGKSSLIRAGLLPSLAAGALPGGGEWAATIVLPGAHPAEELARRLGDADPAPGGRRIVFVDQFEETFTGGADRRQRKDFIGRLLVLADRSDTAVVIAIRADHLDRCATFPRLADRLAGNDILVGPMRDSELCRAVELPAQRAGLEVEAGLVELIVADVAGRAGALPLLSTALAETWERREGRILTVAGYRGAGGVNGALARMADDAYAALPHGPRSAARRLLLRLCDAGDDGDLSLRRRLRISEVVDEHDTDARAALDALADSRLLTIDRDAVELAHEALLREWPRLRDWLHEDVEGRRLHRRLHAAARSWESAGRDTSELYRGTRLEAATDWATGHQDEATSTERAFLDASVEYAASESRALAERARRDARQKRRLRSLLGALAVALVLALLVGVVAVGQRSRADRQRELAQREGRVATARELAAAADANVVVDPERSILLALEAVERSGSAGDPTLPEVEEALHRAVAASRIELHVPDVGGRVDWSPDGRVFVTVGPEGSGVVDIRDARNGESVRSFRGHDGDTTDVAFNHDGTLLATTGADAAVRIWDPATGDERHAVEVPATDTGSPAFGPSFSGDGSLFAAAWPGHGVVKVVDLASGRMVQEVDSVELPNDTSFDPTGTRLAITSWAGPTATIVDVGSGDEVFTLEGHLRYPIMDIAWSPDGKLLATAGFDGSIRVFDAGTGRQRFAILGTGGHVYSLDWGPDATRLVAGKSDGTARVWQVSEGGARELMALSAHDTSNGISGVAFSPDGTRVVTGAVGLTAAQVWDVSIDGDAEVTNIPAVAISSGAADFTSDGRHLVASSAAGSVTIWDARSFTPLQSLGAPPRSSSTPAPGYFAPLASGADVFSLDVSPDGRLVAVARFDGSVRVWDTETGRDAFTVDPGPAIAPYMSLTWSPDGDLLAIAANDGWTGRATVVDRSGRGVAVWQEESGTAIGMLTFTPDGEKLVTTRVPNGPPDPDAGDVVTWDWRTGEVVPIIDTPAGVAVPSPTGHLIATATEQEAPIGFRETVEVWDPATGRRVATLSGITGGVLDLAFNADGSQLATSSQDGTVRIWDPASGERILVLHGHYTGVFSVAFSPDGARLASVGSEGVVRVWALDLDELVEIASRELTRGFTDEECQQYLHTERCP